MMMTKRIPGSYILPGGHSVVNGSGIRAARGRVLGVLAIVILGLAAVGVPALSAKEKRATTKTVSGQVLDANENGIVDAAVSITDLQSRKKFTTVSKEEGQYRFAGLPPGHDFELQAVWQDKSSKVRKISSLDTRLRIVLNFHIPPLPEEAE